MFKPHIGICKCHGKQRAIVVRAGYCKEGNEAQKGKKAKPLKRTAIKVKVPKPTGELKLFKEIWDEREHKSEVDGWPILKFDIWCFSHILPKGLYPKYRLKKENIILITASQHYDWGNCSYKLKELPEWKPVFELYETLKQKYNTEFK